LRTLIFCCAATLQAEAQAHASARGTRALGDTAGTQIPSTPSQHAAKIPISLKLENSPEKLLNFCSCLCLLVFVLRSFNARVAALRGHGVAGLQRGALPLRF